MTTFRITIDEVDGGSRRYSTKVADKFAAVDEAIKTLHLDYGEYAIAKVEQVLPNGNVVTVPSPEVCCVCNSCCFGFCVDAEYERDLFDRVDAEEARMPHADPWAR